MYEGIHAHPDGESTVARHAATAATQGYTGLVVRNHSDAPADYDPTRIRDTYDIDVVPGIEIRAADPAQASGYLGTHRDTHTVVLVHGGTTELNRFATRQPRVDVLANPFAGPGTIDHVTARTAAENNVRIECNLSPILRTHGGNRVRHARQLRDLIDLIDHYDTPYVVTADPTSHLHLRTPRELTAVATTIGFDPTHVHHGLEAWVTIAAQNRERQSDSFVSPGVTRQPPPNDHDHPP